MEHLPRWSGIVFITRCVIQIYSSQHPGKYISYNTSPVPLYNTQADHGETKAVISYSGLVYCCEKIICQAIRANSIADTNCGVLPGQVIVLMSVQVNIDSTCEVD